MTNTNFPLQIVQKSCQSILDTVRQSNLNFAIQETPFSIFITIRKSLNKTSNFEITPNQTHPSLAPEYPELRANLMQLEKANHILKSNYEAATLEIEENCHTILALEKKGQILSDK